MGFRAYRGLGIRGLMFKALQTFLHEGFGGFGLGLTGKGSRAYGSGALIARMEILETVKK